MSQRNSVLNQGISLLVEDGIHECPIKEEYQTKSQNTNQVEEPAAISKFSKGS
jgi:hypothetical protein